MSDLYEQKYLKYRRKYIELKNQLNGGASQNTLTKYDSNNSGLRDFLIKYGGAAAVPAVPAVPADPDSAVESIETTIDINTAISNAVMLNLNEIIKEKINVEEIEQYNLGISPSLRNVGKVTVRKGGKYEITLDNNFTEQFNKKDNLEKIIKTPIKIKKKNSGKSIIFNLNIKFIDSNKKAAAEAEALRLEKEKEAANAEALRLEKEAKAAEEKLRSKAGTVNAAISSLTEATDKVIKEWENNSDASNLDAEIKEFKKLPDEMSNILDKAEEVLKKAPLADLDTAIKEFKKLPDEMSNILDKAEKVLKKARNLLPLRNFDFSKYPEFKDTPGMGGMVGLKHHTGKIYFSLESQEPPPYYYNLKVTDESSGKKSKIGLLNFSTLQHKLNIDKPQGFAQFHIYNNPNSYFYIKDTEEAVIEALKNF